jgi:hypothetical protein
MSPSATSGTGWPGPPFDLPAVSPSNGGAAETATGDGKPPAPASPAPAQVLAVTLPPGAVQVMAVDPSRQFMMVRTDPRMTDAQFQQYVADTRARIPPELWPRIVILPAAQFTVLG